MPVLGRNNVLVCQEKERARRDVCGQQGQSQHLSPVFQTSLLWAGSGLTWLSLSQDRVCPAAAMGQQGRAVGRREEGECNERAAPALLTPGHSQALSWPSPGMGLGWIPRPTLGKCGGCPPAHSSPLLSPHILPRGASMPRWALTFRLRYPSCAGMGSWQSLHWDLGHRCSQQQDWGCFTGTVLVSVPYSTSWDPLPSKEGPSSLSQQRAPGTLCPAALTTDH